MNGFSALIKEVPGGVPESSTKRGCREGMGCESRTGLSLECNHADILILDFPASRTLGNKCPLFINHAVCGILL